MLLYIVKLYFFRLYLDMGIYKYVYIFGYYIYLMILKVQSVIQYILVNGILILKYSIFVNYLNVVSLIDVGVWGGLGCFCFLYY